MNTTAPFPYHRRPSWLKIYDIQFKNKLTWHHINLARHYISIRRGVGRRLSQFSFPHFVLHRLSDMCIPNLDRSLG